MHHLLLNLKNMHYFLNSIWSVLHFIAYHFVREIRVWHFLKGMSLELTSFLFKVLDHWNQFPPFYALFLDWISHFIISCFKLRVFDYLTFKIINLIFIFAFAIQILDFNIFTIPGLRILCRFLKACICHICILSGLSLTWNILCRSDWLLMHDFKKLIFKINTTLLISQHIGFLFCQKEAQSSLNGPCSLICDS